MRRGSPSGLVIRLASLRTVLRKEGRRDEGMETMVADSNDDGGVMVMTMLMTPQRTANANVSEGQRENRETKGSAGSGGKV